MQDAIKTRAILLDTTDARFKMIGIVKQFSLLSHVIKIPHHLFEQPYCLN